MDWKRIFLIFCEFFFATFFMIFQSSTISKIWENRLVQLLFSSNNQAATSKTPNFENPSPSLKMLAFFQSRFFYAYYQPAS